MPWMSKYDSFSNSNSGSMKTSNKYHDSTNTIKGLSVSKSPSSMFGSSNKNKCDTCTNDGNCSQTKLIGCWWMMTTEASPWKGAPRDEHWLKKHEALLNQTHKHSSDAQAIFLGDSITEGWLGQGKDVWHKHYSTRHTYNYGIGGDRTEHIIWRIEKGELDKMAHVKVIVLMIGTNNIRHDSDADIAKGIEEILKMLHAKMPKAKTLLLSILPRGSPKLSPEVPKINSLISKFNNNKTVFYHDLTKNFEQHQNGTDHLKSELYVSDHLHLVAKGYQVWFEAIEHQFAKFLNASSTF